MAYRVKGTPEQEVFREWMKLTPEQREAFDALREAFAVIAGIEESLEPKRPTKRPNGAASDTASDGSAVLPL